MNAQSMNDLLHIRKMSDVLPPDFVIHGCLGKGANNKALHVTWNGQERVLRAPRRKSDTQQRGSSKWEYMYTQRASDLQVSPTLYDAWYLRHAHGEWASGLYFLMEYFPYSLSYLFEHSSKWESVMQHRDAIGECLISLLEKLAKDTLFAYDLKPQNVVLRYDVVQECYVVRIIDFGCDFCEWGSNDIRLKVDHQSPIIDLVRRTLFLETKQAAAEGGGAGGAHERLTHILFATMLVQMSCTTSRELDKRKAQNRMSRTIRDSINPIQRRCNQFVCSMQGRHMSLLRMVLRHDEVRGLLQHYHGRRNAGTRRSIRFAVGDVERVGE